MEQPLNHEAPASGLSDSNVGLGIPDIYIDEVGSVIVVGHDAYRRTSWIDADRAIPDKWKKLVEMPNDAHTRRLKAVRVHAIVGGGGIYEVENRCALESPGRTDDRNGRAYTVQCACPLWHQPVDNYRRMVERREKY